MNYFFMAAMLLTYLPYGCFAQAPSDTDKKIAGLDKQLTTQTEKYLARMARREERLRKRLYRVDSTAANKLFAHSNQSYTALAQQLKNNTGSGVSSFGGEYQPYADTLRVMFVFLHQKAATQLQTLQAKMQDADQIKAYIQQRKQAIGQTISQHPTLTGALGPQYRGMSQDLYYYSEKSRQIKQLLNDPDALERKTLALLNQSPAFQSFLKNNSQLAGLFHLPGNYGTPEGLAGLQTRDQVSSLVQKQVAAGGAGCFGGEGGAAALQANLQSAQEQLAGYKDKLMKLGSGSGDIEMPDFTPNEQKTKTFWKRLEYGANFQTTRNNYYFPTVTDFGLSIGYKFSNSSTAGIGASYKLGWGNGIQHVALSSQGAGIRSFFDSRIKGSFFASCGLEYNYTTPFVSYQQIRQLDLWTKSGLLGISKIVSMKSRVFKKTKLQLLWDFLSYSQKPKTQAILFRMGYAF